MRRSAAPPSCSRLLRAFLHLEHRSSSSSSSSSRSSSSAGPASASVPLYLCPAAARRPSPRRPVVPRTRHGRCLVAPRQVRTAHAEARGGTETGQEPPVVSEAGGAAAAAAAPAVVVARRPGLRDGVSLDVAVLGAKPSQVRDEVAVTKAGVAVEPAVLGARPTETPGVSVEPAVPTAELVPVRQLPFQCHGCGALSQTDLVDKAGYFDLNRRPVKAYLGLLKEGPRRRTETDIVQASLRSLSEDQLKELGVNLEAITPAKSPHGETAHATPTEPDVPLCDRCHQLVYHHTGTPIYHPTVDAIRDTLAESPYQHNHVYHVLDAADFPMSLLGPVHRLLKLTPLRSRNRRQSSRAKFVRGRRTELSFIITRADLLAPKKETVNRLMPYLVETLREALPRSASQGVRLGNVRCVSAKRGWWTKELREEIWARGGAGWMVGKVNVGKSQLFHEVFPKGRMDMKSSQATGQDISIAMRPRDYAKEKEEEAQKRKKKKREKASQAATRHSVLPVLDDLDEAALLPPAPAETNYPQMPIVSSLPGTTASPIRVPFGGGRGELIDLPGLVRGYLDLLVRPEHRPSLVMRSRRVPEQHVLKPGQSLLLGGFLRITPRVPADLVFLSYNFTPLAEHACATDKAIAIQTRQPGAPHVENVALPEAAARTKLAGSFALRWDVTKKRTGPITRKGAVGLKVELLPYRVLSVDILVEGCGWVEIVAQVRTRELFKSNPKPAVRSGGNEEEEEEGTLLENMGLSGRPARRATGRLDHAADAGEILTSLDLSDRSARPKPRPAGRRRGDVDNNRRSDSRGRRRKQEPEQTKPLRFEDQDLNWPVVDVFSPDGRFVTCRRPMSAWLLNRTPVRPGIRRVRPRRSMKGAKKQDKLSRRPR